MNPAEDGNQTPYDILLGISGKLGGNTEIPARICP